MSYECQTDYDQDPQDYYQSQKEPMTPAPLPALEELKKEFFEVWLNGNQDLAPGASVATLWNWITTVYDRRVREEVVEEIKYKVKHTFDKQTKEWIVYLPEKEFEEWLSSLSLESKEENEKSY